MRLLYFVTTFFLFSSGITNFFYNNHKPSNDNLINESILLPGFALPYDENEIVYWTGGPHQFNNLDFTGKYPSGQGSGLDFANGTNFDVLAMATGTVIQADPNCNKDFGCQVAIRHFTGNTVLIYGHLKKGTISVKVGDKVSRGDILGKAGNTGMEFLEPDKRKIHLHIELRDGSTSCFSRCLKDQLGGNPIGWDDLLDLVDGYRIGGYIADSEGIESYNYDGSAIKGEIKILDNFNFLDQPGDIKKLAIVRVHHDFIFNEGSNNYEDNSNPLTQFAGHGRIFSEVFNSLTINDKIKTIDNVAFLKSSNQKNWKEIETFSDSASFISDITLPDGSIVSPNQALTKTWQIKNTGSTTWGDGYKLVFLRGDRMNSPLEINVPVTSPGSITNISVPITAPSVSGSYKGYWQLRNPQGTYFGSELWAQIEVKTSSNYITAIVTDPPSPSNTNLVRVYAKAENFPNFRAMRFKVNGEVKYEIGSSEATFEWYTDGYNIGSHSITVEIADHTDTSWTRAETRSISYNLLGTGVTPNHVPNKPTPKSPYDWYVYYSGSTAQLCAQHNGDPDGDPISGYYFEVSGAEIWNSGWTSNSCVTTASMGPHSYSWRVKVRDNKGGESIWSDSWHYTLVNPTLSITQLYFEPQDATKERIKIRACTEGQGGIGITMKVMVNEATDGSSNGKWNTLYELGVPCFSDIDAPIWDTFGYYDGTHRVRVEAHGLNTGWDGAAVREETYTLPQRRPPGPKLFAPVPTSRNNRDKIFINSRTITFSWEPTIRTNSFTLHVGTNPNPKDDSNPILRQTFASTTTSYTHTFDQDYQTLYWQVTSTNSIGTSSSTDQLFGIDRVQPSCLVKPLTEITYENAFQVNWLGSDILSGIYLYDIQFKDSDRGDWIDWLSSQPSNITFSLFNGQPGHTYYFRCRASDRANNLGEYPSIDDTYTKIDPSARPPEPWWNSAYGKKRNIIIQNNDSDTMPVHYPIRIHFDSNTNPTAEEIYYASLSTVKGNDIRLVYQNAVEINRFIQRFSINQIDIWIPLQNTLVKNAIDSSNYQIYYGNPTAVNPPANISSVFVPLVDSNTVGLWHFQEGGGSTAYDSSGKNNNGAFYNVTWKDSPLGWAPLFNGTSSYASIPHSSVFNTNTLTVEAWVYVSVFDGRSHPVAIKRIPYTAGGFEFRFNRDREIVFIVDQTTGNWDVTSSALEAGKWYHLAGVYNGSNRLCLYVNGVQNKCRDITAGTLKYNSGAITVGAFFSGSGTTYFPGYIHHVRISNIARTDFSYAKIDIQPSVAVGILQIPPAQGKADLEIQTINAFTDSVGGVIIEATVKNIGVVGTSNGFYTDLYVNRIPTGIGDFEGSIEFWVNDPIPAGGTVRLTTRLDSPIEIGLKSSLPSEERYWTLYVQTDSTGAIIEDDKANNINTEGTIVCFVSADSFEGDDDFLTASNLKESQTHNFDRPGDEDWFKIEAVQGKTYQINTFNLGSNADTVMYLYDQDGTTILATNDDYTDDLSSRIIWEAPENGIYFVQLKQWNPLSSGCGTSYTISIGDSSNKIYLPILTK